MPLQLPGSPPVTGEDYRAQQKRKVGNLPVVTSKGQKPDPKATFVVQEKVWGPPNEAGARYVIHSKGERITEERAIELGLLPKPVAKKAPAPENKKRSVSSKGAATSPAPTSPSDS